MPLIKKTKHVIKECRKHIPKEQKRQVQKGTTEKANAETNPPCPHCQRANCKADMCWKGPNTAKRHRIKKKSEKPK